jgi:DNA-binding CsgD family transcriptional regulator
MGADVRAARRQLEQLPGRWTAGDEFGAVVSSAVRSLLPFDGWCLLGLDPNSSLRTFQFGGHGVENTVDNARNEWLMSDVNQYVDLARQKHPVGWLSDAHPRSAQSFRLNQILRPQGVTSELRVVLRAHGRVWGALVLFREHPHRAFGEEEATAIADIADVLCDAVRAHPVRPGPHGEPPAAGSVLLDPENTILAVTADAQEWLADLVPGGDDQTWPKDVTRVLFDAANAVRTGAESTSTCLRTVSGHWLAVTGTPLSFGSADVSVLLAPASTRRILQTCVRHHGLSARESEVLDLAVTGLASKQIAHRLEISVWTVSEHLSSVYRKFGVTGREELVGALI